MRTFVAILTVLGGLLTIVAAFLVALSGIRSKRHRRAIRRLEADHERDIGEHDSAYMALGSDPSVPLPFGGMSMNEHAELINAEYAARFEQLHGCRPGAKPDTADVPLRDEVLAELQLPVILGGFGVVISTVAGTWSLYL